MSSVISGSVIDSGSTHNPRRSSKKGHSTTKDTKEHEEHNVSAKTVAAIARSLKVTV
jgi:hypothetical protein